jgi:DNA-binding MarR family transcriptional regulator
MKTVTDPLTVANELRPVLLKLSRRLRQEVHARGVTAGEVSLLIQVASHPGIGISELAERERVSAPRISKAVQKLLVDGLVYRHNCTPEDRRRVGVDITQRGRQVLESVRRRRTAWLTERLQRLSAEELEALEAAIAPLARLLEADE